ncbi:MAG: hypothetical protein HQ519_12375 [Planctomycetes bacterium]|nr:hypothetical protein [Planctomycetota bacterium]
MQRLRPIAFWAGINLLLLVAAGTFLWDHWERNSISAQPHQSLPEPVRYDGELGVGIFVHDKKTDAKVAGVFVYTLNDENLSSEIKAHPSYSGFQNWHSILRKFGQRYVTDQNGATRIPRFGPEQYILVEKGDFSSLATRGGLHNKWYYLEPNRKLRVKVVNQSGDPVRHAPVAIQFRNGNPSFTLHNFSSDENGIATIDNLDKIDLTPNWRGQAYVAFFGAGGRFNGIDESFALLTESVLNSGEVTLRIPPTGRIQIQVEGVDQNPDLLPGYVLLHAIPTSDYASDESDHYKFQDRRSANGDFQCAPLGLRYIAEYYYDEYDESYGSAIEFDGPKEEGELVTVKLLAHPPEYWKGVIVNESAEPLDKVGVQTTELLFSSSQIHKASDWTFYRSQGKLKVEAIRPIENQKLLRRVLVLQTHAKGPDGPLYCMLELDPMAKEYDLGQIMLTEMPIAASGLLLSQSDLPIDDLSVKLNALGQDSSIPNSPIFITAGSARVKNDGSFHIYAIGPSDGKYELSVKGPRHESQKIPIQLGTENIEIPLQPHGEFFLRVLVDPEFRLGDLRLKYRSQQSVEWFNLSTIRYNHKEGSGVFLASGEIGTPVRLAVYSSIGETILESRDKFFDPPQPKRPLRFFTLDLRGKLKKISLEILNPKGLRVSGDLVVHTKNHVGKADIIAGFRNICTREAIT